MQKVQSDPVSSSTCSVMTILENRVLPYPRLFHLYEELQTSSVLCLKYPAVECIKHEALLCST